MPHKIERSPGTVVRVGGIPWVVGGGYTGKTKELDATVEEAAKLLSKTFKAEVMIRFNSDRRSGGAWIKDDKPGLSNSVGVGLCARLRAKRPKDLLDEQWRDRRTHMSWTEYEALPQEMYFATNVKMSHLKNPALATRGGSIGEPYSYIHHLSLEAALEWLVANVKNPD